MATTIWKGTQKLWTTVINVAPCSTSTNIVCQMPLSGVKVVELSGLAPVPFCGLMLSDFGAEVTFVKRQPMEFDLEQRFMRGKKDITANFKTKEGLETVRRLCLESDVLLDPFRPGVLERIGLDPVELLKKNKKLIVARITAFGQTGSMRHVAAHDINCVGMSGILPTIAGKSDEKKPYWPPANLLADFAGGSMMAAFGIVAGLFSREMNGGQGCIIDVSMTEGVSYLGTFISLYKDFDIMWKHEYAAFTGNCPVYRTYETSDGKYMAVGALERKFSKELFKTLGINAKLGDIVTNTKNLVKTMESIFKKKTRDEWCEIFKDVDACVTPVLDMEEVGDAECHKDRDYFLKAKDSWIPRPAPRMYTVEEYEKLRNSRCLNESK